MSRTIVAVLLVAPAAFAADPKTGGKNLVPNGDFEAGTDSPPTGRRWTG